MTFSKTVFSFISISILILLLGCTSGKIGIKAAATHGLERFRTLVQSDTMHSLTNANLSDAQIAALQLGSPIRVYTIGQDAIKAYLPGDNQKALYDVHQFIYPILKKDTIISGEVIALNKGIWMVRSYGQEQSLRYFKSITDANKFVIPPDLVHVPAFGLDFWGGSETNTYFLAFLGNHTFDSVIPGNTVLMDEVMSKLKPFAK